MSIGRERSKRGVATVAAAAAALRGEEKGSQVGEEGGKDTDLSV